MAPSSLQIADFAKYPSRARALATRNIALLQSLPPAFAAVLLREIIAYDWRFPAEQADIDNQIRFLSDLSAEQRQAFMAGFAGLSLSPQLEAMRWGVTPEEFTEKLTAHLWSTHQMDRFREVAEAYGSALHAATPGATPAMPSLCIVVVGKDASPGTLTLFQKLRPHGTYFSQVSPEHGLEILTGALQARAKSHPVLYGHWYVDGGPPSTLPLSGISSISYDALAPVREVLLKKISTARSSGAVGPEDLRSLLTQLQPSEINVAGPSRDEVLQRFELTLLTEGSGTQIFSTTFVQWAAREILRRARPLTIMTRYAPRQVNRDMNAMLSATSQPLRYDPAGSLVDADMGAFYTWINLGRLTGAESSRFLAWFEDQRQAIAIGPSMAHGAVANAPCNLSDILGWLG